jgi:hypothetical protein
MSLILAVDLGKYNFVFADSIRAVAATERGDWRGDYRAASQPHQPESRETSSVELRQKAPAPPPRPTAAQVLYRISGYD